MQKITKKIVSRFFLAGFLIPCPLFALVHVRHVEMGVGLTWLFLIPWPTFPFMMSAEAGGGAGGEFLGFVQSALLNAMVYGVVGFVVSFFYRRFISAGGSDTK
jgi:hypothetical protein